MSDEKSEQLVLKSSSTEYNFYNSDESRSQSILSSNSSNIQTFKKNFKDTKNLNGSLGVVKEVSNNVIEEDPEEDIRTSKDNSSSSRHFTKDSHPNEGLVKKEINEVNFSTSSQKSDVDRIVEFMKDLLSRCNLILSFYQESKNHESIPFEVEMAYLLNTITNDIKVFITTVTSAKNIKNESNLQIITESNEKITITDDLIKLLKLHSEFQQMKAPIVQSFMTLSDYCQNTRHLYNQMSDVFKKKIHANLAKYSIDLMKESVVLEEEGKKEQSAQKKSQAQFLLDEAYAEHKSLGKFISSSRFPLFK